MGEASRPAPVARVDDDPVAQAAAERVVLLRYERDGWTKAQALEVLRALGLQPYEPGGKTDALGRREVTARSVRRQRARAAAQGTTPTQPQDPHPYPDGHPAPENAPTAAVTGSTGQTRPTPPTTRSA